MKKRGRLQSAIIGIVFLAIAMLGFLQTGGEKASAETIVIDDTPQISKENITFSHEQDHIFKTGDVLTIEFSANNWQLTDDTVTIYIANQAMLIHHCLTGETTVGNCYGDSYISEANVSINENHFTIELTLKEKNQNIIPRTYDIFMIKIENGYHDFTGTYYDYIDSDYCYNFSVSDECASGKHTIKTSTEYTTDSTATCTEDGTESKHCIVCKTPIPETIRPIPAFGHKWNSGAIIEDATPYNDGKILYICTECYAMKEEAIKKLDTDEGESNTTNDTDEGEPNIPGNTDEKESNPDNGASNEIEISASDEENPTYDADGTGNISEQQKSIAKLTVKPGNKAFKYKKLKKKKAVFQISATLNGKKLEGGDPALSYKLSKCPKGGRKYVKVSPDGKVTLKKGAKKGTYKIRVTAEATDDYAGAAKTVKVKIK